MANSLHVKKGDRVKVIAGNDKGKVGEILSVDPRNNRVVVEGVNVVKKHRPANPGAGRTASSSLTAPGTAIASARVRPCGPPRRRRA